MRIALGRSLVGMLALWGVWASTLAHAHNSVMRLCVPEQSSMPLISPDGQGDVGRMIYSAAADAQITILLHRAPVKRCIEEIRHNLADGIPIAPYLPSMSKVLRYPMLNGQIDIDKAVTRQTTKLFRRRGSEAYWDGHAFVGTTKPVLIANSAAAVRLRLESMGAAFDAGSATLAGNFAKLLAGRGDVVVGLDKPVALLLQQAAFSAEIEEAPLAWSTDLYYLALSPAFLAAHPSEAQRLWEAIGYRANASR